MKTKSRQLKTYICAYCNVESEIIGIAQLETHYYAFDMGTKQWKDFHGDENIELHELFCIKCNKKIKDVEL